MRNLVPLFRCKNSPRILLHSLRQQVLALYFHQSRYHCRGMCVYYCWLLAKDPALSLALLAESFVQLLDEGAGLILNVFDTTRSEYCIVT